MWWATLGFIVIEGAMFAMLIATAVYLRGVEPDWPPNTYAPPDLFWGTLNTAILLASVVPNHLLKKATHALDLRGVQRWLLVQNGFAVAFLVVRAFEFGALGVRWDSNAYGSIAWFVLGFHTLHLLTDAAESAVLTFWMFQNPGPRRFEDVSEECIYWDFVVLVWLPLYAVLYWLPRWT
ncbi:MAG: cytochrome C oxidase subunit III [Proteobacteria bacterium]|nr:MAG: cytochrome C oxidase subunit III [Pseudomonadota bacterium]